MLIDFAEMQRNFLRDPYTGLPLNGDWLQHLETGDVQELADFVLTKYYDLSNDAGIGDKWLGLESQLAEPERLALLGSPFGPQGTYFDPGRMGSYFQDEATVKNSLHVLRAAVIPAGLTNFIELLDRSAAVNRGIYVTF